MITNLENSPGQRRHWRATEAGVRTEDGLEGAGSEGNPEVSTSCLSSLVAVRG